MRRLTSMLVAGVLAGGTVLAGVASAGASTAKPGTAKPATIKPGTATHRASCTNEGPFFFNVMHNGANFYLGTPNNTHNGVSAILKPKKNGTTLWTLCVFSSNTLVFENRNLAMTSRSTSPGSDVTMTPVGNSGDGFSSQQWNYVFTTSTALTFQNVKTGLYLRIRNNGPKFGQSVTTGFTPKEWTLSM
jgi:hypothetical protein